MAQDIIDAEFETIRRDDGQHPVRRVVADPGPLPAVRDVPALAPADDQIGILKEAKGREFPSKRAQILYALTVLFSSIAAFLVSGGHVLLREMPHPGQALALEIARAPLVAAERRSDEVVTVNAKISNRDGANRRVPDVLMTFVSRAGEPNLVYRVPRGELLAPGKTLAFTVRMPKKPGYDQAPRLEFDANGV